MTELTKIDTTDAIPAAYPTPAVAMRPRAPVIRRSKTDQAFMEMIHDIHTDPWYHRAATFATYGIGVIAATVLFSILTAVFT